jgi:two-component system LytT family response regulator
MPLQVVIADDEVLARQKLLQLLRDEPDIEVVGEGANAAETIDLVQLTQPDVLLLDIRMPGMDGFDVISALSCSSPSDLPGIIFTTAHDQYALKAFEVHAVDYLLKPFTRERLRIALQLRKRRNTTTGWSFAPKGASCFCPLRIFGGLARKKIM